MRLPPHRFCNFIVEWCRARIKPEEWEKFKADLEAPLPGEEKKASKQMVQNEANDFMAAMSATQGVGRG